jgi:predicted dehydrogenase
VAKAWNSQLRKSLGHAQPKEPPATLDFDLWLGPAPVAPYYPNRVPGNWRFFIDYGVGDIGNDGVHDIDVAAWGLGLETLPNRVAALGGKYFFDDDQEWPDTQYVVCEYDAGNGGKKPRQLIFEQRIWSPYVQEGYENGCAFYGTTGVLLIGHGVGWKLYGERNKPVEEMKGGVNLAAHHQNFITAILNGDPLAAPITLGHISAGICHLANISTRLRRTVEFDPAREVVTNSAEANALLRRKYRPNHWAVPRGA